MTKDQRKAKEEQEQQHEKPAAFPTSSLSLL